MHRSASTPCLWSTPIHESPVAGGQPGREILRRRFPEGGASEPS